MHNIVVHLNESTCRKSGHLGMDQVYIQWLLRSDICCPIWSNFSQTAPNKINVFVFVLEMDIISTKDIKLLHINLQGLQYIILMMIRVCL